MKVIEVRDEKLIQTVQVWWVCVCGEILFYVNLQGCIKIIKI